ncbi:MAG: BACON domain-containing protein, partial [Alistipes sp.]
QIDNEGYVAFIIGGDLTRTMQGRYYIEIEIVKNSNSMISQTTYAFEVAASSVVKYTSWLRVTPQRLNLKATDTGADIRVCASGQWSVTTDVLWLSFSVLNGNGATKLHLMCETNVTTAKRTGIMTITMDSRSITVRVTQGAAEVV